MLHHDGGEQLGLRRDRLEPELRTDPRLLGTAVPVVEKRSEAVQAPEHRVACKDPAGDRKRAEAGAHSMAQVPEFGTSTAMGLAVKRVVEAGPVDE